MEIERKRSAAQLPGNSLPVYSADISLNTSISLFRCAQTERLQALLADNEKVNLLEFEPIPLPLEPRIQITGIVPETATLFKVKGATASFDLNLDRLNSGSFPFRLCLRAR